MIRCSLPVHVSVRLDVLKASSWHRISAMPTSAMLVLKPESTCVAPLPMCCISAYLDEWSLPDGGSGGWVTAQPDFSLFLGWEKLIWFIFLFKRDIFKTSLRSWNMNLHISSYNNIIFISLLHCTTSSSYRFWTRVGSSWRRHKLLSGELSISPAPSASLALYCPFTLINPSAWLFCLLIRETSSLRRAEASGSSSYSLQLLYHQLESDTHMQWASFMSYLFTFMQNRDTK